MRPAPCARLTTEADRAAGDVSQDLTAGNALRADPHHDLGRRCRSPPPKFLCPSKLDGRTRWLCPTGNRDRPPTQEIVVNIVNAQRDNTMRQPPTEDPRPRRAHQDVLTAEHIQRRQHQRQRTISDRHSSHAARRKTGQTSISIQNKQTIGITVPSHRIDTSPINPARLGTYVPPNTKPSTAPQQTCRAERPAFLLIARGSSTAHRRDRTSRVEQAEAAANDTLSLDAPTWSEGRGRVADCSWTTITHGSLLPRR